MFALSISVHFPHNSEGPPYVSEPNLASFGSENAEKRHEKTKKKIKINFPKWRSSSKSKIEFHVTTSSFNRSQDVHQDTLLERSATMENLSSTGKKKKFNFKGLFSRHRKSKERVSSVVDIDMHTGGHSSHTQIQEVATSPSSGNVPQRRIKTELSGEIKDINQKFSEVGYENEIENDVENVNKNVDGAHEQASTAIPKIVKSNNAEDFDTDAQRISLTIPANYEVATSAEEIVAESASQRHIVSEKLGIETYLMCSHSIINMYGTCI